MSLIVLKVAGLIQFWIYLKLCLTTFVDDLLEKTREVRVGFLTCASERMDFFPTQIENIGEREGC